MGWFGKKEKAPQEGPPAWCVRAAGGALAIESGGLIPYTLKSKSFFGPRAEEAFFSSLESTLSKPGCTQAEYAALRAAYVTLLTGLREILVLCWTDWPPAAGTSHTITHDPYKGDTINIMGLTYVQGSLTFLEKAAKRHNELTGDQRLAWDAGVWRFELGSKMAGPGVVSTRTQMFVTLHATPAVLQMEIDRLSAAGV